MPTKTPREKIHEFIKQNYNENTARCVVALVMPVFETLLEEARQDERNKFLERIEKRTAEIEEQLKVTKSQFVIDKLRGGIEELRIIISSL